jgi:hypothetical protein
VPPDRETIVNESTWYAKEDETVPTRKALETLRSAEERMKIAEGRLRAFIERPNRRYSPAERAENKRLLDDLRLAMVEYSKAFEQAVKS